MSEAAFLAAICANPSDDTPRLVFADWLEEHGLSVRAAFIRDQIELARTDEADPRYPELLARTRRSGVLTDASHRLECERGVTGAMFRRGFVAGVWGNGYGFPECDSLPMEQLRLSPPESGSDGDRKSLLKRPELSRLQTLALGERWPIEDIAAITRSPKLAGLRALAIGRPLFDEPGQLRRMVARMKLPALESFNLHFDAFPLREDEDAEYDERDPDLSGYLPPGPPLRRLNLVAEEDTHGEWVWPGPDYDWLTASSHWPTLEVADVTLNANPISGTDFVAAMPPGEMFARLATSRLTRLTINGSSLDRLLATPDWGNVRTLAVHDQFNTAQLARLFTSPQAQKLESLTLCGDHVYHEEFDLGDLPDVIRTPGLLPKLRRLSLRSELAALANGSYRQHLLRLDVGTKGVLEEALQAVLDVPLPQLRHLTLSGFRDAADFEPLFTTANTPNLCTLQLGDCKSTESALAGIARNPAMPHLSLLSSGTWQTKWLVIRDGVATPVANGTLPLDEDWWEPDPLATWFW